MSTATPETATPLTPAGPSSVLLAVVCWHCNAAVGAPCVTTTTGAPVRQPHAARIDAASRAWRSREMWFVLRADDERFGLAAGDVLRCVDYPLDVKVSVLFRESDGYDPACNQYTSDVAFLAFVPFDMETTR